MPDVTRIIEQTATESIFNDDWLIKDSPTNGTTKIQPSVLKAWINDGMATEEELETAVGNIADTYNTSESYVVDDLCIHEYALYKCIGATTGTWDSTKWQATTIAEIISTIDLSAEAISYNNTSSGLEAENVQDAIGETITKLSAVGSASGAIATFDDGSDLPMPKLEVAIEPQQDLHGYDSPWVGGAGKNLFHVDSKIPTVTISNVEYSSDDEYIYLNGTKQGGGYADLSSLSITLDSGTYYIKAFVISGTATNAVDVYPYDGTNNLTGTILNIERTLTFSESKTFRFRFAIWTDGTVLTNYKIGIVISKTSGIDKFYPYSNICPISGWDEVNVSVCGKNLYKAELNNYYLDVATGLPIAQAGYEISGFIPILANQSIYIPGSGSSRRWFYDKFKNPKTYLNNSDAQTYTAQEDGYIRVTLKKTISTYSTYQIEYGSTATAYKPYNGQIYTIDLDGTRYGGTLDVISGVLTVDRAYFKYINVSTTSGTAVTDGWRCNFTCPIDDINRGKWSIQTGAIPIFNKISSVAKGYGANEYTVTLPNVTSKQEADAMLEGLEICYKLATPLTIQLTPTQVNSLLGVNNIYADTGDILDAEYIRDMTTIIDSLIARIEALENQ